MPLHTSPVLSGRHYGSIVLPVVLVLLIACQNAQLPLGASLSLSPAKREFDIVHTIDADGGCVFDSQNYIDIPLSVSLEDAQGAPLGRMPIVVYADFIANAWRGLPVFALFVDRNGNGVVDGHSEAVGMPDTGAFMLTTGRWTGTAGFFLRVNLSCPYAGRVLATAGPLRARTHILVRSRGSQLQPGVAS